MVWYFMISSHFLLMNSWEELIVLKWNQSARISSAVNTLVCWKAATSSGFKVHCLLAFPIVISSKITKKLQTISNNFKTPQNVKKLCEVWVDYKHAQIKPFHHEKSAQKKEESVKKASQIKQHHPSKIKISSVKLVLVHQNSCLFFCYLFFCLLV